MSGSQIGMVILIAILVLTVLGVFDAPAIKIAQQTFPRLGPQGSAILAQFVVGVIKVCWIAGLGMIVLYMVRFGRVPNIFGEDI